jgi:hypothetical protein
MRDAANGFPRISLLGTTVNKLVNGTLWRMCAMTLVRHAR